MTTGGKTQPTINQLPRQVNDDTIHVILNFPGRETDRVSG
jgi:hypothetical protein